MYNYVRAVALPKKSNAAWESVDLSNVLVSAIFSNYEKVVIVATNPVLTGEVFIDIEQLRAQYSVYNNTLTVLLQALGDQSLTTINQLPIAGEKVIQYRDAYQAGYKVTRTKIGVADTSQYPVSDLIDLKVVRKTPIDMRNVHQYCLTTVNGLIHRTDATEEAHYIIDAANGMLKSNKNHVGLISFHDVGKLTQEYLTADQIQTYGEYQSLKEGMKITLKTDLTGKSYFFVINGYMVYPQDLTLWGTGGQDVLLDVKRIPLLEQYFESENYVNNSYLGLTHTDTNDSQILYDEFYSDVVLKNLLTGPRSFVVIVDAPRLYWQKRYIRPCGIPGLFNSYQEPKFPLFVGFGRMAEYWKRKMEDVWAVEIADAFLRNYVFRYSKTGDIAAPTSAEAPNVPFTYGEGYLLEIGRID